MRDVPGKTLILHAKIKYIIRNGSKRFGRGSSKVVVMLVDDRTH